ncbi:DUF3276 family protein [Candidatus Sumerlaeota bacterium]|nr:DUF3276 family protein [Candidatus Sumerlaeota bacterium]
MNENRKFATQQYENQPDEIFSRKIFAGRRTYYLDIKVTSKKDKYIVIAEKRRTLTGSKNESDRIMIFKEDFTKFFDRVDEIREWLEDHGDI